MTCLICGSDDDGICRNPKRDEDDQHKVWRGAFYDTTYGQDQIARAAIFNSAKQFLLSIGCSELKWTVRYDGSDIDFDYGMIICGLTYKGKKYTHNPCFRLRCELPVELMEKLDAEFAIREGMMITIKQIPEKNDDVKIAHR
ncbi:MAG: hypothetical protein WB677_05125 [Xanthobacteraceae bacterium]